jgi:hypothetical protein
MLRGRWCHIVALNAHAPTEDNTEISIIINVGFDVTDQLLI